MARFIIRILLGVLFLTAGTLHLCRASLFVQIMPPWIPFHHACVIISGVCELLGGVGLLIPGRRIQIASGWFLTLLLVAIFPANIYMTLDHVPVNGKEISPFLLWARLSVQPVLIVAVLWVTRAWSEICKKEVKSW